MLASLAESKRWTFHVPVKTLRLSLGTNVDFFAADFLDVLTLIAAPFSDMSIITLDLYQLTNLENGPRIITDVITCLPLLLMFSGQSDGGGDVRGTRIRLASPDLNSVIPTFGIPQIVMSSCVGKTLCFKKKMCSGAQKVNQEEELFSCFLSTRPCISRGKSQGDHSADGKKVAMHSGCQ